MLACSNPWRIFGLLMKAAERDGVVDQPVAHHLERNKFAVGFFASPIDDRHATAPDRALDAEAVHLLSAEPIVRAPPKPLGHELGEHHAKLEMTHGQPIEFRRRHEHRTDTRVGDDRRGSRGAGHERHLPDDIAAAKTGDAVIGAILVAQHRMGRAFKQDPKALGRIALAHHDLTRREQALRRRREQVSQGHRRQRRQRPAVGEQLPQLRGCVRRRHPMRVGRAQRFDRRALHRFGVRPVLGTRAITSQCQSPWAIEPGGTVH